MASPAGKFVTEWLRRSAAFGTKAIGMLWGEHFPFWYISEYPKSGGTWLGKMIASYLDIPLPQHSKLPVAMKAVLHNHWRYSPRLRRVFYLYRDGRDIMVSFYFHRMRAIQQDVLSPYQERMRKRYARAFGDGFEPQDTPKNLPAFIELEMTKPRSSRISWPEHIRQWSLPHKDHVAYLSYEELLSDPHETLSRALSTFLDTPLDHQLLDEIIERYSFARMTKRKPGQEDRSSFIRKGVAGDWANHFTREAAEVFHRHAGETLIQLGYEKDADWVTRCPEAAQELGKTAKKH
jgi:hypothetical protein